MVLLQAHFRLECLYLLREVLNLATALILCSSKDLVVLKDKNLFLVLKCLGDALLLLLEKSFLSITFFQLEPEVLDLLLQEGILLGEGVTVLTELLRLYLSFSVLKMVHEMLGIILHVMN